jgi:NADPH:quinone reductase-like Zn-dependent oxidoreductase
VGDDVYGDLSQSGWGGFAEYVCADEEALALKPPGMSFEQAAATPQAGLLALQGLRMGDVGKGRRVLINGAGGGVGTFAIQMAKSAGAEVTGVDSQDKLERVRGLGADRAIDYRQEDFTESGLTYDVILEVMARRPLSDYRRALNPGGICVLVGGATSVILRATAFGSFGEKRIKLLLHKPNRMDLDRMSELFDQGTCVPVIDRSFDLTELVDAFRYYESGRHIGKVVVKIGGTIGSVGP